MMTMRILLSFLIVSPNLTAVASACQWSWNFYSSCGTKNYVGEHGDCLANLSGGSCYALGASICDDPSLQHTGTCYEDCMRYHRNCCCPPDYPSEQGQQIPESTETPTQNPTQTPTFNPVVMPLVLNVSEEEINASQSTNAIISGNKSCQWSWIWIDALSSCGDENYVGGDGLCLADASGGSCYSNGATICNDLALQHTGTCYEDCMRYHRNCCCPPSSPPETVPTKMSSLDSRSPISFNDTQEIFDPTSALDSLSIRQKSCNHLLIVLTSVFNACFFYET
mmetsp:Transcript_29203/g.33629  ORF Transcript_29203/g.33629 Transcript_29203/m.33629 type:complete len:281 (-) Transcript_29203:22-864(-)